MFKAVDIGAAVFVAVCVALGLKRGLSGELARLTGTAVALAAAWFLHGPLADWLASFGRLDAGASRATAFAFLFAAAWLACLLARTFVGHLVRVVFAPKIERVGGLAAGLFKGLAWTFAVFAILNLAPNEYLRRVCGEESAVGRLTLRALPALQSALADERPAAPEEEEEVLIEPPEDVP